MKYETVHKIQFFCLCLFIGIILIGLTISAQAARKEGYIKIIDSSSSGFGYAYAPSMIYEYETGKIHCWVGSSGTGSTDWDHIRYTYSTNNGATWSTPVNQIVGCPYDRCACDPSVVQWVDGYWYNFYSGNVKNVQTCIFVARASSPDGVWYKYTQRGTWEQNPSDPKVIVWPKVATPDVGGSYGAGQATVVRYNDMLLMWYTDTTATNPFSNQILFTMSENPVSWSQGTICTGLGAYAASVDVKWDPYYKTFVLYSLAGGHSQTSYMARFFSRDGLNWQGPFNVNQIPNYSHNPGVMGNKYGAMCWNGSTIYAFGCPYDMNPTDKWAYWDLYSFRWRDMIPVEGDFDGDGKQDAATVDARLGKWYIHSSATGQLGVPGIPWGWQWNGHHERQRIACADYDGDGITEAAIVDDAVPGGSKWYVYQCNNNLIPWGSQWTGMGAVHELIVGDYNGDGKADRAICHPDASGGARYYVIDTATGGGGVPGIPWGAQITGQTRRYTLIVGDYDGDNKCDRAFLNPFPNGGTAASVWFVLCTATGQPPSNIPWGWQWAGTGGLGWIPIIKDWNNDNKDQRAMVKFPSSSGSEWYIIDGSSYPWGWQFNGMGAFHGPVAGDYDNDGSASVGIKDVDLDDAGACWYVDDSTAIPWGWKCGIGY